MSGKEDDKQAAEEVKAETALAEDEVAVVDSSNADAADGHVGKLGKGSSQRPEQAGPAVQPGTGQAALRERASDKSRRAEPSAAKPAARKAQPTPQTRKPATTTTTAAATAAPRPDSAATTAAVLGRFFTNKHGFPIIEQTWEHMWMRAAHEHPDGEDIAKVGGGGGGGVWAACPGHGVNHRPVDRISTFRAMVLEYDIPNIVRVWGSPWFQPPIVPWVPGYSRPAAGNAQGAGDPAAAKPGCTRGHGRQARGCAAVS